MRADVYNALICSVDLKSLLRNGEDSIFYIYPETQDNDIFPCIYYMRTSESDIKYADNIPLANQEQYQIHIYAKDPNNLELIEKEVKKVLKSIGFVKLPTSSDLHDRETNTYHVVMNFERNQRY